MLDRDPIENHYGADNTCDSNGFFGGKNFCDIYVTSAIAGANDPRTGRIPESGDFSEMRFFPADPVNGARHLVPGKILYANEQSTGVVLDIKMFAHDADSTTAWKKVLAVAGDIATKTGVALVPIQPKAGAITAAVGSGLSAISDAIPENEDDFLGAAHYAFTREDNRWGTTSTGEIEIPLSKRCGEPRSGQGVPPGRRAPGAVEAHGPHPVNRAV
jgi:hypothetical protein